MRAGLCVGICLVSTLHSAHAATYGDGSTAFFNVEEIACSPAKSVKAIPYETRWNQDLFDGTLKVENVTGCGTGKLTVKGAFFDSSSTEQCAGTLSLSVQGGTATAFWEIESTPTKCSGLGDIYSISGLHPKESDANINEQIVGRYQEWVVVSEKLNCRTSPARTSTVTTLLEEGSNVKRLADNKTSPVEKAPEPPFKPWTKISFGKSGAELSCYVRASYNYIRPNMSRLRVSQTQPKKGM